MKKILCTLTLILLLSSISFAGEKKINIGLWGGYNTISMKDVNDELAAYGQDLKTGLESAIPLLAAQGLTGTVDLATTELKSALGGGVELTYKVFPNFLAGIKTGYFSLGSGECESTLTASAGPISLTLRQAITSSGSLIPVLAGGRYYYPIDKNLYLNGGLFAGMSFANTNIELGGETNIPGQSVMKFKLSSTGSAFTMDGRIGITYKDSTDTTFGLSLGYFMANIAEMTAQKDIDADGDGINDIEKDKPLRSITTNEIVANDFSGISIALELAFPF
ncbi:MAG: hypothetical protein GY853_02435 [PVC group bacterium]|nr:hypothetical protein [PVC group bacterium]